MRFQSLEEMKQLLEKGELRVIDKIPVTQEEMDWYRKELGLEKGDSGSDVTFNGYPLIINEFLEIEVQGDLAA